MRHMARRKLSGNHEQERSPNLDTIGIKELHLRESVPLYLVRILVFVWAIVSINEGACICLSASGWAAEVTLEVWNSDASLEAMEWYKDVLIPAFEKTHPGVKVEVVKTPWGQALTDKTVTGYAAGMGPDIIYGGAEFVDGYVENKLVTPH